MGIFLLEWGIFITGDDFAYGNVNTRFFSQLHWWKPSLVLGTPSHTLSGHGLPRWDRMQGTLPAVLSEQIWSGTKQGECLFLSESNVAVAVVRHCETAQHWEVVQKFTLDHSHCIYALNLTLMEIIYSSVLGLAGIKLIFSVVAVTELWFGFRIRMLVAQGCVGWCWAGLTQSQGLLRSSSHQRGGWGAQGVRGRYSQDRGPQMTEGTFQIKWHHAQHIK